MTSSTRRFLQAVLPALLAILLATGCASLRPPAVPANPPAGRAAAQAATQAGFNAVYDGELRIWFYSFKMIWYVAVPPGGTGLSVAVLSPVGVKIMQMNGTRDAHSCTVALPAANRLKPYGEALWTGLLWSLTDDLADDELKWTRHGDTVLGDARRGAIHAQYRALAANGMLVGKEVRENGRRLHDIRFADERHDADRSYPGRIQIECASPRCKLTLTLKSLRWSDGAAGANDATGR